MHFLAQGPIVWEPTTGREEEIAQTPEDSEDEEKGEGRDNILLESLPAQVSDTHTHNFLLDGQYLLDFVFSARRQRC